MSSDISDFILFLSKSVSTISINLWTNSVVSSIFISPSIFKSLGVGSNVTVGVEVIVELVVRGGYEYSPMM